MASLLLKNGTAEDVDRTPEEITHESNKVVWKTNVFLEY
jgi:hypothetical protein